jgi:hypothetical protein
MSKTHFRPDTHGFAFINVWTFEPHEINQMNHTLNSSVDGALGSLPNSLASFGGNVVNSLLKQLVGSPEPVKYGLCGGMAFASLDYYNVGKQPPRGKNINDQPHQDTANGKILREYLWRRQLESMASNFPGLLSWMTVLHIGLLGGPGWLCNRTKEEWAMVKKYIDQGHPWPICLIGSSQNPFHNHQVLAYGYNDPGDGTGTVYVYDMNCPDKEHTIHLDFRANELQAQESCPNHERGSLRGFFCEVYADSSPPDVEEKVV